LKTRKDRIVYLLLNYIALEGALTHFNEKLPKDNNCFDSLYREIEEKGFPEKWDKAQDMYVSTNEDINGDTNCKLCWSCLKLIRNNLFHANKARKPDTPKRLDFLLDWSYRYIDNILSGNYSVSIKAKEIKDILEIN